MNPNDKAQQKKDKKEPERPLLEAMRQLVRVGFTVEQVEALAEFVRRMP